MLTESIYSILIKRLRECTLSNQIDTEYEEEQRIIREHGEEQLKKSEEEEAFIMADIETMDNYDEDVNISMNTSISDTLNVSMNRSGQLRMKVIGVNVAVQTDPAVPGRPKLRVNEKKATDKIKSTCTMLSSTCGVSVETSRKIVQIDCKEPYNHDVYLSPMEQVTSEFSEGDGIADEPNVSVSTSTYKNHTYVIPSARTIDDHKQILASDIETEAARMLYEKEPGVQKLPYILIQQVVVQLMVSGRRSF